MPEFPLNTPVLVDAENVRVVGEVAHYSTIYGTLEFDIKINPVRVLDGSYRQALMLSTCNSWFLEMILGGITVPLVGIRLFHQRQIVRLPEDHPLVQETLAGPPR